MPRGSNFLLLRQKKVTKEKATPTFALIRDLKRKRRAVRNSLRSNNGPLHRRFRSKSRARMNGDPSNENIDGCAIVFCKRTRRIAFLTLSLFDEHVALSNIAHGTKRLQVLQHRFAPSRPSRNMICMQFDIGLFCWACAAHLTNATVAN